MFFSHCSNILFFVVSLFLIISLVCYLFSLIFFSISSFILQFLFFFIVISYFFYLLHLSFFISFFFFNFYVLFYFSLFFFVLLPIASSFYLICSPIFLSNAFIFLIISSLSSFLFSYSSFPILCIPSIIICKISFDGILCSNFSFTSSSKSFISNCTNQ